MMNQLSFWNQNRGLMGIACLLAFSVLLFSGCAGEGNPGESSTADTEITSGIEADTTTSSAGTDTAESADTSAPETTLYFDVLPYISATDTPAVITAAEYEKQAVDSVFGGPFDFVHRISIPALDSTAPGAKELNAKIFDHFNPHIEELKTGTEGGNLYHISYSSSSLGCMVFICVQADGGLQYSEGWHSNSYYYYDAAAGREVTAAEYLEYFGLDAESLVKAAALSDAYLRAMGTQSYYYGETGGEELRGLIGAESASPEAYEVTAETIRVWMRTSGGYIDYSFVCDIDAASGVPCRPSYIVETSEFSVDKNCEGVVFDFTNGTLQSAKAVPEIHAVIKSAYITSAYTVLVCTDPLPDPNRLALLIDGEKTGIGSAQSYGEYYVYCYFINEYTPLEDLQMIAIVPSAE